MNQKRDYLYMHEIISMRFFLSDDGRFGLHLEKKNGETLDAVFCPEARPDLERLRTLLNNHMEPERGA